MTDLVSSRRSTSVPAAGERPSALVLDTMQRWLEGDAVWPYAKILRTWGPEFEMYRRRWSREDFSSFRSGVDRTINRMQLRNDWIKLFGFAIPCAELLDELAKASHVVEVGAGSGYMTRLMRHRGINVTGSDIEWRGPNCYRFETGVYDDHQVTGTAAKTMVRRYPDSTVFCSWPSLNETWFRQMLKAMRIGQRIVIVREDACAEDSAWQYLDDCFKEEATIDIPTFEHMNDYASVHLKKRQRSR